MELSGRLETISTLGKSITARSNRRAIVSGNGIMVPFIGGSPGEEREKVQAFYPRCERTLGFNYVNSYVLNHRLVAAGFEVLFS